MFRLLTFLLVTVLVSAPAAAQLCNPAISMTTPQPRFQVNADGTVDDHQTGVTWQRCPIGYEVDNAGTETVYTDDRCIGSAQSEFGWQAMLLYAQELNATGGFAGAQNWRVPNVKELSSIVERQCSAPAINAAVFPDTPAAEFWSSTIYDDALVVDFVRGGILEGLVLGRSIPAEPRHLRLVRDVN